MGCPGNAAHQDSRREGSTRTQLETLADLAEEYSDGIAHVTTRQDFQLHYVHIEDTPSVMRRLAAANITTREACGNSVRNVTACPYSGVCPDEKFDVTPYSRALSKFLLGHPDTPEFRHGNSSLPSAAARSMPADWRACTTWAWSPSRGSRTEKRSAALKCHVGGGLGAVPYQAKLFDSFVPPEELLPLAQAIARVFARLGEKKNRSRARIKFLVQDLGIEKFKELVLEERKTLPDDPRWTEFVEDAEKFQETPLRPGGKAPLLGSESFQRWVKTNTRPQKQEGYTVVTIALPLGRHHRRPTALSGGHRAPLYEGNDPHDGRAEIVLRWVSQSDLIGVAQGPRSRGTRRSRRGQHR